MRGIHILLVFYSGDGFEKGMQQQWLLKSVEKMIIEDASLVEVQVHNQMMVV